MNHPIFDMKLDNEQILISKKQMKNLKILLRDIVECSTKESLWIAQRREEEITAFLNHFVGEPLD